MSWINVYAESSHSSESRVTIPVEVMKGEPLIADLIDAPEWPVWMGDSCSVLGADSCELDHMLVLIKLYV